MTKDSEDDIPMTIPCGSCTYLDRDGQVHNNPELKRNLEILGIDVIKSIQERA